MKKLKHLNKDLFNEILSSERETTMRKESLIVHAPFTGAAPIASEHPVQTKKNGMPQNSAINFSIRRSVICGKGNDLCHLKCSSKFQWANYRHDAGVGLNSENNKVGFTLPGKILSHKFMWRNEIGWTSRIFPCYIMACFQTNHLKGIIHAFNQNKEKCKMKIVLFSALLVFASVMFGVEVKIEPKEDNNPKDWIVNLKGDHGISCQKESDGTWWIAVKTDKSMTSFYPDSPIKTTGNEAFAIRAQVKGKGAVRLGIHLYSKKGYVASLPGEKLSFDSPDKAVSIESRIRVGTNSEKVVDEAERISSAFLSIQAFPNSDFVIGKLEYTPDGKFETSFQKLVLPEVIYAVPGVETNIYFENVFFCINPDNFIFDADCPKGRNYQHRWSFIPAENEVGTYPLSLTVIGENGTVAKGETKIVVAPANAGKGKNISILMVGDSLTDATVYPTRLHALVKGENNPQMKMIGSHCGGSRAVAPGGVAHEGYGGWAWSTFLTQFNDNSTITDPKKKFYAKSKFLVEKNGKPEFDLQSYVNQYNDGKMPDFITIQLGVNDVFGASDLSIYDTLAGIEKNMDALIAAFRKAAPDAVIGVGLVTAGAKQDAFGANYKNGQTAWQYKKNSFMLNQLMIQKFQKNQDKKLFLIPTPVNLDCSNNFPAKTEPVNNGNPSMVLRQSNGVHPAETGYIQMGDTYYAWLKYQLSLQK